MMSLPLSTLTLEVFVAEIIFIFPNDQLASFLKLTNRTATQTLKGIEAMHMIKKGQIKSLGTSVSDKVNIVLSGFMKRPSVKNRVIKGAHIL
jgi:hypothetical protein